MILPSADTAPALSPVVRLSVNRLVAATLVKPASTAVDVVLASLHDF